MGTVTQSSHGANIVEIVTTGDTSDNSITISTDVRSYKRVAITFKNIGAKSLNINIQTRNISKGQVVTLELNTQTLTAGSTIRYLNDKLLSIVEILVQSTVTGNPTSYLIEYAMEMSG